MEVEDIEATSPTRVAAASIFAEVWSKLEAEKGADGMSLPKEVMWLGGAPGAGKGTNTRVRSCLVLHVLQFLAI